MFEHTSISDNNLCYDIKKNEPFLIVMSSPEFHLAKVKEMHNGVVRVKGNANSVNLLRMEGGFVGVVLVGSSVIFGILFSVMSYGENGLFESVMIGLGVFLFFIAFILLVTGLVSGLISSLDCLETITRNTGTTSPSTA